jgi:(4-alkanoyl-5-oxo-2,5-dihydrofuran-3-yl)methyl phosphate reductase
MILVIGATGAVGTLLVTQLVDAGRAVRVLTRNPERAAKFKGKVEVVVGDLDNEDSIAKAMRGVERFFLITASTQQDRNALAAAKRTRARHVVKISTQEAGWTPVQCHGHWHKEREELIRASGQAWTFLRPSMYMNFALSWIQSVRSEKAVYSAGGEGKLAPIDPRDVALVAKAALTTSGHENVAYELTGPELLSFGDMAAVLSRVIGRSIRHVAISDAEQGAVFAKMGLPEYTVKGLVETFSLIRTGRFAYLTKDVEKATGNQPRTFETWAQEHVAAFQ